jgi:hypothetical protein
MVIRSVLSVSLQLAWNEEHHRESDVKSNQEPCIDLSHVDLQHKERNYDGENPVAECVDP